MALGAAKLIGTGAAASIDYGVIISPSDIAVSQPQNGGAGSPTIGATVTGGVGPFTFEWSTDQARFNIIPDTISQTINLGCSGYNELVQGNLTCTVTDAGNANAETSSTIVAVFLFGNAA